MGRVVLVKLEEGRAQRTSVIVVVGWAGVLNSFSGPSPPRLWSLAQVTSYYQHPRLELR